MTEELDTFAIGDVHGRADLLNALIGAIRLRALPSRYRIIFLGDIIDRGPDSRAAVNLVEVELKREPQSVLIRGNHEEMMLRLFDMGHEKSAGWHYNGGLETVRSYGFENTDYLDVDGYHRFKPELAEKFANEYPSHLELLRASVPYVETSRFVLVHAGIVPHIPLQEQDPYAMRWKSGPIMEYSGNLEKIVVHGHVITDSRMPEVLPHRVAIDTGAYATGRLTAVRLSAHSSGLTFLSAVSTDRGDIRIEEVEPIIKY
jgi:serine/threonine protein phosphatase 1